ncbi:MAG: malonyl-CoA decarboxylase [Hyphomicrobiales bacterium]
MNKSFFRDLIEQIVDRGRSLTSFSLGNHDHGGTIETLSKGLLSGRGESSGVAVAQHILGIFDILNEEEKTAYFRFLATTFSPDEEKVQKAASAYVEEPSPKTLRKLYKAIEPPRQEFFRRLNLAPGGTAAIVRMRAALLERLLENPDLKPVDSDLAHLFGSWFNRGFLVMQHIDWATPANILEKIIEYEAVHEIQGWDDLKSRLDPVNRRCYGFFHPSLVDEPLIFVEVALTREVPASIHDLLEPPEGTDAGDSTTAVFYSISNCQKGLQGTSFGSFLIKQVVSDLSHEMPGLNTFVTLSPVPGFTRWLGKVKDDLKVDLEPLSDPDWVKYPQKADALQKDLTGLAARYFLQEKSKSGKPLDPVARFHLGNGARLERINWMADLSSRGLQQSAGIMVNYLYDLRDIERNHEAFAEQGVIAASSSVKRALPPS